MSGHKIYAPKGVGALFVRKGTRMSSILFGGHHERERRPGTENVPGAVALGCAAECAARDLANVPDGDWPSCATGWRPAFWRGFRTRASTGRGERRTPNTTNIYFDGIDGEALVIALDLRGFAVSTGSACSSGAVEPSHVLTAIGLHTGAGARAASVFRWAAPIPSSRWTLLSKPWRTPFGICARFHRE